MAFGSSRPDEFGLLGQGVDPWAGVDGLGLVTAGGQSAFLANGFVVWESAQVGGSSGPGLDLDLSYLNRTDRTNPSNNDDDDDDPQAAGPAVAPAQGDATTLGLSPATQAMHVDLSVPVYYPTADPSDTITPSDEVANVIGARDYDNVIIGNDEANQLTGGEHSDSIQGGGGGDDLVTMNAFLDSSDTIDGGAGDDSLSFTYAGDGSVLNNVTGVERIILGDAATTLTLGNDNLAASGQTVTIDGSALTEALTFDGSAETDGNLSVLGGAAADSLTGGDGADTLEGGDGNDTLAGGAGTNTLSYATSSTGVTVSLGAQTATGGDAEGDTITWTSFLNLTGSAADDTLTDSGSQDNHLQGLGGDDLFYYLGGEDSLSGGDGDDTFSFSGSPDSGTVIQGGDGTDILAVIASADFTNSTVSGIEGVEISAGGDCWIRERPGHEPWAFEH
ncbi:calcium-binding protein [Desulfocurvus sp. DL9XJH121]